ncbi:MAG: response regulator [Acetatifactor sp.]|nr:response regulator [Acetatifactor sp.]
MEILAVDDEAIMLANLVECIKSVVPCANVYEFKRAGEALEYIKANRVDVAFMDINMRQINGIELAKTVKACQPNVNIVFCTGYSEYMADAFEMYCSGYLMKPITAEKIKSALENLRFPISGLNACLRAICFGNFDIMYNNIPLVFKYEKTKEMLAYLVARNGATCTNNEIIAAMFEDDESHASYFRNLKKDLMDTLRDIGCEELICASRGNISVNVNMLKCDYYDWLKNTSGDISSYRGQFMSQYSWSEYMMMH